MQSQGIDESDAAAAAAAMYLEPRSLRLTRPLGRQYSANDSGILEMHGGSRHGSRVGLAIPNDCYTRGWNSDQEDEIGGRRLLHRMNSHPPLTAFYSLNPAVLGQTQVPVKFNIIPDYEELPNRGQGEVNHYTPIDEGSIAASLDSKTFSKPEDRFEVPNGKTRPVSQESNKPAVSGTRMKVNPLYDERMSVPSQSPSTKPGSFKFTCDLQKIGFLFAVAALTLALVSILTERRDDGKYEELGKKYKELENNYTATLYQLMRIAEERSDTKAFIPSDEMNSFIQDQVNMSFSLLQTQIDHLISQYGEMVQMNGMRRLNYTYDQPTKLTNMSACSHRTKADSTSSTVPVTEGDPVNLNNYIVLGVLCTTDVGNEALLKYDQERPNVYICVCRGGPNKEGVNRRCIIHYWVCPKV